MDYFIITKPNKTIFPSFYPRTFVDQFRDIIVPIFLDLQLVYFIILLCLSIQIPDLSILKFTNFISSLFKSIKVQKSSNSDNELNYQKLLEANSLSSLEKSNSNQSDSRKFTFTDFIVSFFKSTKSEKDQKSSSNLNKPEIYCNYI